MKQINMIIYICLFLSFAKTICLGDVEYQEATKNLEQVKENPNNPGAFDRILKAWENLKILDSETAAKYSSYIDRLKSIFQSEPAKPVAKPTEPIVTQKTELPATTEPAPKLTTPEPSIKQEIIANIDQTTTAIKQAVTSASTVVQEKAVELCEKLSKFDISSVGQTVATKIGKAEQACANLKEQIGEAFTEKKEVIVKQLDAAVETINTKTAELSAAVSARKEEIIQAVTPEVQQLCEMVQEGVEHFTNFVGNLAKDTWEKAKDTCTPLLDKKPVEEIIVKEPVKVTPATIKIAKKTTEKPAPEPKKAEIKIKEIQKSSINPFFAPAGESQQSTTTSSIETTSSPNPFATEHNPFLTTEPKQIMSGKETLSDKTPLIAIEKQPTITFQKTEEKTKSNLDKVIAQNSNLFNDLTQALLAAKEFKITSEKISYLVDKKYTNELASIYQLYKKLSKTDKPHIEKSFTLTIESYVNLLLKQINAIIPFDKELKKYFIIPFVDQTLKDRINYEVFWLDINANITCQAPKKDEKTESISFNKFTGWITSQAEEVSTAFKNVAIQTEAIVCSKDELLFTLPGKEWEAVTTKSHVEKMIQEYNVSIDIIQKGIAEPVSDLMHIGLKDLIPADKLTALKKACAPLINVTESTVDFTKDITTKKEDFFKDNGDLTTLYNLWIRYLNKYLVKKNASKWTDDQRKAFDLFNNGYFTPLHKTMKQLQTISEHESTLKKMITAIDSYVKD